MIWLPEKATTKYRHALNIPLPKREARWFRFCKASANGQGFSIAMLPPTPLVTAKNAITARVQRLASSSPA